MRYILLLFSFWSMNFQSFGQTKKKAINYDSAINKTVFISYFTADTITLNDNWRTTNRSAPHYLGLKNQHKDFIEIAARRKKEDQFYTTNISDAELLNKDAEFEAYRYKVNKTTFEKIYSDDTCYVFNENRNRMDAMTIVGIKNDYVIEIIFHPAIEDQTKNLDYLLTLFKNLNIK
ncbi:MAG TPA: hypothetical protein VLB74_02215 [Flavobacterium sp.]|uniref:hypothetical protein n=1 Tax=Flavobacterium sp. TaxID=239 RepID=UPI002C281A24|nr:hypothetical protein [Flavobacterium sp.]HSD13445.1 hypothetical protein [Flavobacterium sp.]